MGQALICGSDNDCPLRKAARTKMRGSVADIMFKKDDSYDEKTNKISNMRVRLEGFKQTLSGITPEPFEYKIDFLEAIDDGEKDSQFRRALRSLMEGIGMQKEKLTTDKNGDVVNLDEVEGVRVQMNQVLDDVSKSPDVNEPLELIDDGNYHSVTKTEVDFEDSDSSEKGDGFVDETHDDNSYSGDGSEFCGEGTVMHEAIKQCVATYSALMNACKNGRGKWSFTCERQSGHCSDESGPNAGPGPNDRRRMKQKARSSSEPSWKWKKARRNSAPSWKWKSVPSRRMKQAARKSAGPSWKWKSDPSRRMKQAARKSAGPSWK